MGTLCSLRESVCVYVCVLGGAETWRVMGLSRAVPPTWFGHPCTLLTQLVEVAWSEHQVEREWAQGVLCGLERDVFVTRLGW